MSDYHRSTDSWIDSGQVVFDVHGTSRNAFLIFMLETLDSPFVKQESTSYLCASLCSLFKPSLHLIWSLTIIGPSLVSVINYLLSLDASHTPLPE